MECCQREYCVIQYPVAIMHAHRHTRGWHAITQNYSINLRYIHCSSITRQLQQFNKHASVNMQAISAFVYLLLLYTHR